MPIDFTLAPTPPMGFNTWNRFGMDISEALIDETMDALVSTGLAELGYVHLNIDDGWMAPERSAAGALVPDPQRFPGGIKRLADRAHGMGLKLGLYSDCGRKTCGGLPASYGHERQDADTFARWGIDYLKHDWCHVPFEDFPGASEREVAQILYGRMSDALVATGRPVVLSMCSWGHGEPWEWARGVGHLWRTTPDIMDTYHRDAHRGTQDMLAIFERNVVLDPFAGPGGFNDPDMLEVGNGGMTAVEYRTHFALWCMMAAPLLLGCDLRGVSAETLAIVGNRQLIAINQDPLGQQARRVWQEGGVHVLAKPLADGGQAVAVFNQTDGAKDTAPQEHVSAAGPAIDVWTGARERVGPVHLEPHQAKVWRVAAG